MKPLVERFREHVSKTDYCWLWNGAIDGCGYARFGHAGRNATAHRVSYQIHVGEIPKGMHVCHRCDVRHCVNPDHLFIGTNADNVADKMAKGRQWHPAGELHHKAKLNWEKVREIRTLWPGVTQKLLASKYGVSSANIAEIVHGKIWKEPNLTGGLNACK